jgi:phosphoglycolate phosphatase-like HAD superfamily hydrolase
VDGSGGVSDDGLVDRDALVLLLWDVDNTLIDSGGASKANYRRAFELLTGRPPEVPPETGGRTDVAIMGNLLRANGEQSESYAWERQEAALAEAGRLNRPLLEARGAALAGAAECLVRLAGEGGVIQAALTGNIEANARVKLGTFGLDRFVDFSVGAFGAESDVRALLVPVAQGKAAARYGFDPSCDSTVLIGDTALDVEAGRDGGARVIGVGTGGVPLDELLAAGADAALDDLVDVDRLVHTVHDVAQRGPVRLVLRQG